MAAGQSYAHRALATELKTSKENKDANKPGESSKTTLPEITCDNVESRHIGPICSPLQPARVQPLDRDHDGSLHLQLEAAILPYVTTVAEDGTKKMFFVAASEECIGNRYHACLPSASFARPHDAYWYDYVTGKYYPDINATAKRVHNRFVQRLAGRVSIAGPKSLPPHDFAINGLAVWLMPLPIGDPAVADGAEFASMIADRCDEKMAYWLDPEVRQWFKDRGISPEVDFHLVEAEEVLRFGQLSYFALQGNKIAKDPVTLKTVDGKKLSSVGCSFVEAVKNATVILNNSV